MGLRLITAPETLPVTVDEAKRHLRVDTDEDDDLIETYIRACTKHLDADAYLCRALEPQTWELAYDAFPVEAIEIPFPPIISIDSVTYDDEDGNEQTIASSNYEVDRHKEPGWVVPIADYSWPSTLSAINAVRVLFTAGYERSESDGSGGAGESRVPEPIKTAIMIMVADLYEHRESVATPGPITIPIVPNALRLLTPYRIFR